MAKTTGLGTHDDRGGAGWERGGQEWVQAWKTPETDVDRGLRSNGQRMEASITFIISKEESKRPLWHFPALPSLGRQGKDAAKPGLCPRSQPPPLAIASPVPRGARFQSVGGLSQGPGFRSPSHYLRAWSLDLPGSGCPPTVCYSCCHRSVPAPRGGTVTITPLDR